MSTVTKQQLLAAVAAVKPGRSAWARGVQAYAIELVDGLNDSADLANETMLRKALLNGADNWQQYSEGGCALIYDADIAERLCSPSELKRCKGGERQPNARENWIDCQARALSQASALVRRAYAKAWCTVNPALLIAAAPDLLTALAGCADALREAGKDFAQANKLAARPNLYELHEQAARAAIAKAKGGAA